MIEMGMMIFEDDSHEYNISHVVLLFLYEV